MASILAFDPGGTTGWCALKDGKLAGGSFHQWDRVEHLIISLRPDVVIAEDWLLYSWMAKKLSWDRMIAPRVLGVIEYCCQVAGVRLVFQSASEGKPIRLKKIDGVEDLH